MKAVRLPTGGVALPPDLCAAFAVSLRRSLEESRRRNGVQPPDDVVHGIELIDIEGAAWLNRTRQVPIGSESVPKVDVSSTEAIESMSVKEAAAELGISERAVTKRIGAGSLDAHRERGMWRVHARSIRKGRL